MFSWFRKKGKSLEDMSLKEVTEHLYGIFPAMQTRGDCGPPTYRCSRWILLRGPYYGERDKDYKCSVLLDATQMYDWAVKNSTVVGYSHNP